MARRQRRHTPRWLGAAPALAPFFALLLALPRTASAEEIPASDTTFGISGAVGRGNLSLGALNTQLRSVGFPAVSEGGWTVGASLASLIPSYRLVIEADLLVQLSGTVIEPAQARPVTVTAGYLTFSAGYIFLARHNLHLSILAGLGVGRVMVTFGDTSSTTANLTPTATFAQALRDPTSAVSFSTVNFVFRPALGLDYRVGIADRQCAVLGLRVGYALSPPSGLTVGGASSPDSASPALDAGGPALSPGGPFLALTGGWGIR